MGQVPGEIVAAAFGCFNPKVVDAGGHGWAGRSPAETPSSPPASAAQRRCCDGCSAINPRASRGSPSCSSEAPPAAPWAGRPIYSGLRSLGFPDDPMAAMWRAADLLREHRGDSHVITWAVGGVDGMEILLLTEQWWGLPARAYAPTRGWQAADMDAGFERLQRRGLMTDDEQLTDAGRAFREEIEVRTDELDGRSSTPSETTSTSSSSYLDAWSEAIIAAGSYPQRIAGVYNTGGGPHFGSGLTIDTAASLYKES